MNTDRILPPASAIKPSRRFLDALKLAAPMYRVALAAGINPETLSKIVRGGTRIKARDPRVLAVARVLGLRPAECFENEGEHNGRRDEDVGPAETIMKADRNGPWIDRIGDRLDHPERVPHELRHLIQDDQARVAWICKQPVTGEALEVGCSDGSVGRHILTANPHVTLVQTDLEQWDIRTPPLEDYRQRFTVVYCCEVLEHLRAGEAAIAATHLKACLRVADGCLVVTVPNQRPAPFYVAGCRDRWRWPGHQSVWTRDGLRALFARAGFDAIVFSPLYPEDRASRSIWLLARVLLRRRAVPDIIT